MATYSSVGATAVLSLSADGTDSAPLNPNAKAIRIVGDDLANGIAYLKFVSTSESYSFATSFNPTPVALNSNSYAATTEDMPFPEVDNINGYSEILQLSGMCYVYGLGDSGNGGTVRLLITELF